MITWRYATTDFGTATRSSNSSASSFEEFRQTNQFGSPVTRQGTTHSFLSASTTNTESTDATGGSTSWQEIFRTVVGTSESTNFDQSLTFSTFLSEIRWNKTSNQHSVNYTESSISSTSSSEVKNSDGDITSSSTESTTLVSGSTEVSYTYTLQNLVASTYVSTQTTTVAVPSVSFRVTSATSTSTTSNNLTSITSTITTFTTTVSRSSITVITPLHTFTNGTISFTSNLPTQTTNRSFRYVTGALAEYNEIIGIASNTYEGLLMPHEFSTFTYTSTFAPSFIFTPGVTIALDTVTTTVGTSTVSTHVSTTHTRLSSSTLNTGLDSATTTATKTVAISDTVIPFTRTLTSITSVSFSVTSTTLTTQSLTLTFINTTFFTTTTTQNIHTFTSLTISQNGNNSFTYSATYAFGWSTTLTTIGHTTFGFPLIHTGFSTSVITSATYTSNATNSSFSSTLTSSYTFHAGGGFETAVNSNNAQTSSVDVVVNNPVRITAKSYPGSVQIGIGTDKALLALVPPNANFSTHTIGTNLTPLNLPSQFVIPATYGQRTDGPFTPLGLNNSTVLTFSRNSTGGNGGTVHSNSYTTFSWQYSKNSLSITTLITYTVANGTSMATSTSSSSTSLALSNVGGGVSTIYSLFNYNVENTTTTFSCFPLGGLQRYPDDISLITMPYFIIGTTYSTNGSSDTYKLTVTHVTTFTLNSSKDFSVEQFVKYYHVRPGHFTAFPPVAGPVVIFSRNFTRN